MKTLNERIKVLERLINRKKLPEWAMIQARKMLEREASKKNSAAGK